MLRLYSCTEKVILSQKAKRCTPRANHVETIYILLKKKHFVHSMEYITIYIYIFLFKEIVYFYTINITQEKSSAFTLVLEIRVLL